MKIFKTSLLALIIMTPSISKGQASFSSNNIVVDNFKCTPDQNINFNLESLDSTGNLYLTLLSSWLAHEKEPSNRKKQLEAWGFERHINILKDGYGHRGYLAETKDYTLISFRGTQTKDDYISNALFYQTDFSKELGIEGAKTHRGMAGVYRNAEKETFKALQSLGISKSKPIIMTGHSLGGTLAILYGYKLKSQGYNIKAIYTAGSPKVGNKELAKEIEGKLSDRHFSVSMSSDITPMVPPAKTSALSFSSIISRNNKILRSLIYNMVVGLDFVPTPGKHLKLFDTKEDSSLELNENLKESEIAYWREISTQLSDRSNLEQVVRFIQSRFVTHHPDYYICGLNKLL